VAHIYFSTAKKSYIIADTPGHVDIRVTWLQDFDLASVIILIDARKGVIEQTYRTFLSIIY
jgi:sulfate adenylyltransferase subunit 1